jgi:hypothetical protein
MTNSAAHGGASSTSPGHVGRIGYDANPTAEGSSGRSRLRDAGGTHEHTLADPPQGDRTERR